MFTLIAGLAVVVLSSFYHAPGAQSWQNDQGELADEIERQIVAYAVSSCGSQLTDARIGTNGEIQYSCAKNETVTFNLYQLHKTYKYVYGIDLVDGSVVSFYFANGKSASLTFNDAGIAKAVYQSLLELMNEGKDRYAPDLPLDINETVDSINAMLHRLTSNDAQLRVNVTGTMIITNRQVQFFYFNVSDLKSSEYSDEGFEVNGIELVPCTYRNVAANNWIKFNGEKGTVAYIKFYEADDAEVGKLHQLFIHLRTSLVSVMYS